MNNEQIWFFRFEQQKSKDFTQVKKTWQEATTLGLSLESILSTLSLSGETDKYNFYIFSGSMKAAVQLLNDKSVYITWQLYCQQDSVVEMIVRPIEDVCPNSSRCPSSQASLAQRRTSSGRRTLSEIMIRPPIEPVSENVDAMQLIPLNELPVDDKVVIDLGEGKSKVFSMNYLLGWINAERENGKNLENIIVTALTPSGQPIEIALNRDIWTKSLLRGPWKDDFFPMWDEDSEKHVEKRSALQALYDAHPSAHNNAKIFVKDLKQFGSNKDANNRLLTTNNRFFLGLPYFNEDAVAQILKLPFGQKTLEESLTELLAKKAARDSDELCTSHDLAPMMEKTFGLDWAVIKRDKSLKIQPPKLPKRKTMGTLRRMFSRATLE